MSLFNIKLKTKNGNDIKKKETFTVFFTVSFKKGLKPIAEYTYRIIHSNGIEDQKRVLALKDAHMVKSIEDLTLKVMLNFCHILGTITKRFNVDPDFVLFISNEFGNKNNKSWQFLSDAFKRPRKTNDKGKPVEVAPDWMDALTIDYEDRWDDKQCKKFGVKKEELDLLKAFGDLNPNTMFMTIDPERDKVKYAKSLGVIAALKDRIDRNLQITPIK
jgi:hypothetical protein